MSFWSGETLIRELPNLIEGYERKQIDCAAYTLRMGSEVYISPSDDAEASTATRKKLEKKESFVIPSGQFAFLLTEEKVKVPKTAIAFISMKARIKWRGLINVSGFHVDPGYEGPLVFSVFNAGPSPVHLAQGDNCFLIWYASLDLDRGCETAEYRKDPPLTGITSDLINPIAGEVQSLKSLAGRMEKVEREHQILRWIGTTLVTLAVAMFIRGCSQQTQPSIIVNPPAATAPVQTPAAANPAQGPGGAPPLTPVTQPAQTAESLPNARGRGAAPARAGAWPNSSESERTSR